MFNNKSLKEFQGKFNKQSKIPYVKGFLFLLLGLIMYATMFSNIIPDNMNVQIYDKATEHIWAEITIEDKEKTEEKQQLAADEVPNQYTLREKFKDIQIKKITALFNAALAVRKEYENSQIRTYEDFVEELAAVIKGDIEFDVKTSTVQTLVNSSVDQLQLSKENAAAAVNDVMNLKIKQDDIESAKQDVKNKLLGTSLSVELREAVIEIAQFAITPNYLFDPEKTSIERQRQSDSVEPVFIREGQLIVEKGQVIDEEIYRQLQLVGLLDKQSNILPFVGLFFLVVFLLYVITTFYVAEKEKRNSLGLYVLIFFLSFLVMKVTSIVSYDNDFGIAYIVPIAMGTMIITILISERLALVTAVIFAICGSIIFNPQATGTLNFTHGVYILCSSLAGIVFISKRNPRGNIFKAGIFIGFVDALLALSFDFIKHGQTMWIELGATITFSFLSGIIAAILTMGILPYLEAGFGILSSMKLIELSNPNHPLLRKLLLEAPGTYHHSIMVANLAESASEAIGANGLLARVGAFYHDIGKAKWPQYFIENQMNMENPHDKISPQLSRNIITAHPYDGAKMLRKHKMPQEIIDIAEQHHGTTCLHYFYTKAKESNKAVNEADFRYQGPKPQGKETAIIMICDSIEAAVRSLKEPTPAELELLVRNIIRSKLEDGQFDECNITIKELNVIAMTICDQLKGIFHSRIAYPDENNKKVKRA
jgi:cyclic-di-AMP phosphodiesterase PgpH